MKIGIVGPGFIVENFIESTNKIKEIDCIAICSRKQSNEKAEKLMNKYHIKKHYFDFDDMIKDKEIDFIYIASPNSLHYTYALKALESGKNVISEKPFATTVEETKKLAQTAKKNNLFIFEAITTIHLPNYKKIKESINKLGNLKMVQCNFSQYSSRYDDFLKGNFPNVFNPKFSGGSLYDINVYNIHFVVGLFGKPKETYYYANISNNIDTSGTAILIYDNFICECCGAKDSQSPSFGIIQGEKGYIKVDDPVSKCSKVEIGLLKETPIQYNEQETDDRMVYELKEFLNIYINKNYSAAEKLFNHTMDVMNVLVDLRKFANIKFECDNTIIK